MWLRFLVIRLVGILKLYNAWKVYAPWIGAEKGNILAHEGLGH